MKLTEEEFDLLALYESNMRTALRSGYARNPGRRAMEMMQGIYNRVAKVNLKINTGCSTCILNLLKDCGRIYFADKEEREAAQKGGEIMEETPEEASDDAESACIPRVAVERIKNIRARKKVPVKTRK